MQKYAMLQVPRLFNQALGPLVIMSMRVVMLAGKFLLALFIARFIGLEALGIYGLIAGAAAVGQVFMRLGMFGTVSRQAVTQSLEELTFNLRNYGIGCLLLYTAIFPAVLLGGWQFDNVELAVLTIVIVALEHLIYDIFILTNNLQRPMLANVLLSLQSASWIYLFIPLAFFFPSLRSVETILYFWIGGGILSSSLGAFAARGWPWRRAFANPLQVSWYVEKVRVSARIYAAEAIGTATLYIDRYLITLFLNLELVGVYVLFWQVINAICNLVTAGVLQIFRPQLIAAYARRNFASFEQIFRRSVIHAFATAAILALVAAAIVPFLIQFTDKPLAMHYLPLFWMLLAVMFFRITFDLIFNKLFAKHDDATVMNGNLILFVSSALISPITLMTLGIYGVILTITLSYLLFLLFILMRMPSNPARQG